MIAETKGMLREIGDSSEPFLNFTKGVRRETFAGIQSGDVYPGTNRYSLKVCEGSSKK